ncbi:hypothetical protein K438DRAFT_526866 [Mycena galopus ATCC 62051]|nr:hypothetical protein K438DRAFT_526866 [Mycena galopus ATCC 62051]
MGMRAVRTGEPARGRFKGTGTGDAERRGFILAGLAGRGMPPFLEVVTGEPGRGIPAARRLTWAGGAGVSPLLGPGTRRNRSSSWVLSLGDSGPTRRVQTFSRFSARIWAAAALW